MNLKTFYWYFNDIFPKKFINKILKTGLAAEKKLAVTGKYKDKKISSKEKKDLCKTRYSEICWLSEQYIYDAIYPYLYIANKNAGWNFEFSWSEDAQFTVYKKDMHYDWHMDSRQEPYPATANPNLKGKIRKITSVLLLSDPKDFEGGELQFNFKNGGGAVKPLTVTELKGKGSLIVFPSFVWHRVKPVTKGVRYSMPIFHVGQPWK